MGKGMDMGKGYESPQSELLLGLELAAFSQQLIDII